MKTEFTGTEVLHEDRENGIEPGEKCYADGISSGGGGRIWVCAQASCGSGASGRGVSALFGQRGGPCGHALSAGGISGVHSAVFREGICCVAQSAGGLRAGNDPDSGECG